MNIFLERDLTSPDGATSQSSLHTDVINALNQWAALSPGRDYRSIVQVENRICVDVNWSPHDSNSQDTLLMTFCRNGIKIVQSAHKL